MADHLQRPGGANPARRAHYIEDARQHVAELRLAIRVLAAYGTPAPRTLLTDAALDLKHAVEKLAKARDELLKVIDAEGPAGAD